MGYKIAIDVGGTFTDVVYTGNDNVSRVVKTPTTTGNEALGVLTGIERIAAQEASDLRELLSDTDLIIHGTTIATNTMLEFNGAKTGLIATKGFRDDIEIRRGYKERIFNPQFPPPVPVAQRRNRLTVNERIDREGNVLTPLDESEVRQIAARFRTAGIESVAVCLYFGFMNPAHEKKIGAILDEECPEIPVSLAHEILPQIHEFERVSTTLVNAYTSPRLKRYLTSLEGRLRELGFKRDFFIMLSGGGIMTAAYAVKYAVHSLLSGPAGGVVACAQLIGEVLAEPNLINVDMGGTSYDVSLIRNNKPSVTTDYWFSRYRVAIPMLDIHTIGAGGGSIAWIDPGGALQVGPQSAGAVPGPACYGRGGIEPTVTDANLVLGYLDADYFLGGEIPLDRQASEQAIREKVAKPLGLSTVEAAMGIFRIVNNNMANGIRFVSVQRGHDPRDFTLVAFGGNGAVHAGLQARELGIRKVIVPRIATAFSARGMLSSNIVLSKSRTYIVTSDAYDIDVINDHFASMRSEVDADLPASHRTSKALTGEVAYHYAMDMHYTGETHEITVPLPCGNSRVSDEDIRQAVEAFHAAHEQLHTFANRAEKTHFMNLRLETVIHTNKPPLTPLDVHGTDSGHAVKARRPVYFPDISGPTDTPIYEGARLRCGNIMAGPCVIEEPGTTIVVYPGMQAGLSEMDNYEIAIG
ncbi:MAG: hydantoinase/oxoprolinase family protein [Candidatus Binatia bacterium]|jgi:N-methylhydantoinase A